MVNITINNKPVSAPEGTSILNAAKAAGIEIPTLCYLEGINQIGACRVCVVEVEGMERLAPACDTEVGEGMAVSTDSAKVRESRRMNVQLMLARHDCRCAVCVRSGNCELQSLAKELNILDIPYESKIRPFSWDRSLPIIRDSGKCVDCMRCVSVCEKVQGMGVWQVFGSGERTEVGIAAKSIAETDCTYCGQCITHCPTGALSARDDTGRVFTAIADPEITTVVQVAPAVRTAWAEQAGIDASFATIGRMVSAIRALGFNYVFDTNFSADLTIAEEGSELIKRISKGRKPMFTSCCPGWVSFMRTQYPEYADCLSTAKSPQQMFGAVAKSYFAEKADIDPKKMFVVSIMPCSAKKNEAELPESYAGGLRDVDAVITTRELGRMLTQIDLDITSCDESCFDSPLGEGSGAAAIFGVTGGVMDAALRSAYALVTGTNPDADAFTAVRGTEGFKEANFSIPGIGKVKTAVVSGLSNAKKLMERVSSGRADYDFVEVMACPGGCVGGGGQPISKGAEKAQARGAMLWDIDHNADARFSYKNTQVQALYKDYLGEPLSDRAHSLLHVDVAEVQPVTLAALAHH